MKKLFCIVLMLIACGGGGNTAPAITPNIPLPIPEPPPIIDPVDPAEIRTIVMLGTSLTSGSEPVPLEGRNGMGTLMELHDKEMNTLTWNFGVGGHSSRDLIEHLAVIDYYGVVPDIVTIETGMNDSYRRIPYDEVKANLKIIIDFFKAKDAKIYLMTTNPSLLGEEIHPNLEVYYALYHDIAAENGVKLIDFYVMWLTYTPGELDEMIPDGCHPSMAALEIVVWPVLAKMLKNDSVAP
jgi:lysophospholipase L1-like esterase